MVRAKLPIPNLKRNSATSSCEAAVQQQMGRFVRAPEAGLALSHCGWAWHTSSDFMWRLPPLRGPRGELSMSDRRTMALTFSCFFALHSFRSLCILMASWLCLPMWSSASCAGVSASRTIESEDAFEYGIRAKYGIRACHSR